MSENPMQLNTTRFGTIGINDGQMLTFGDGLLGFPEHTRYALIEAEIGDPFLLLRSLVDKSVRFLVIEPSHFFPSYYFTVKKAQIKALDTDDVDDLQVLVLVTIAPNILDVTANLLGPIVFNKKNRIGMQILLDDFNLSTREPLFNDRPDNEAEAVGMVTRENRTASARAAIHGLEA